MVQFEGWKILIDYFATTIEESHRSFTRQEDRVDCESDIRYRGTA